MILFKNIFNSNCDVNSLLRIGIVFFFCKQQSYSIFIFYIILPAKFIAIESIVFLPHVEKLIIIKFNISSKNVLQ